jgi:hypothetical protein
MKWLAKRIIFEIPSWNTRKISLIISMIFSKRQNNEKLSALKRVSGQEHRLLAIYSLNRAHLTRDKQTTLLLPHKLTLNHEINSTIIYTYILSFLCCHYCYARVWKGLLERSTQTQQPSSNLDRSDSSNCLLGLGRSGLQRRPYHSHVSSDFISWSKMPYENSTCTNFRSVLWII